MLPFSGKSSDALMGSKELTVGLGFLPSLLGESDWPQPELLINMLIVFISGKIPKSPYLKY